MWFALMYQRRPPVYFPLFRTTRSTQDSRVTKLRSWTNQTSIECRLPSDSTDVVFVSVVSGGERTEVTKVIRRMDGFPS